VQDCCAAGFGPEEEEHEDGDGGDEDFPHGEAPA
jgi:hypothetical protein